jgi:hypothetical protein
MTIPSATQHTYPYQNEPIWSKSERLIARTAFDAALGRELHEVIQEVKKMASQIRQSSDLWDLESYLTQRRKEIDRSTTIGISDSRTCSGNFCTKADSGRKSCAAYGRTSWTRSVLAPSSWPGWTRHDWVLSAMA